MSIKVNLHKTHRQYTDDKEVIEVDGSTVGECLKKLTAEYPELEKEIFDKKGKLLNAIEIYINLESAYPDELARPTTDGDRIHITLMLAGG